MSTADPRPDLAALLATVDRLERASLPAGEWSEVVAVAERTTSAIEAGHPDEVDRLAATLSNMAFRSEVRGRLGGRRGPAPVVAPTKQTPVLPVVGLVCGAIVVALGWALGGGPLLVATVVLALFIVGIAVAGTHTVARRRGDAGRSGVPDEEWRIPEQAAVALARLREAARTS
jgi:hypothetical protein